MTIFEHPTLSVRPQHRRVLLQVISATFLS